MVLRWYYKLLETGHWRAIERPLGTPKHDSCLDVDGRLAGLLALGSPDALALSGLQDLLIE
jgi:hypothetical protein